jgi:crotonobetainyl-CoA:carnitine CoA-transferase CaiB-like acyl-CoA transferase
VNALEGVVLVDFGQYLAGPFGPMIIGDLGADVIKVEPITGDGMRMVNKPFFGCQRGKRDIALDLKTERGHEIALRLVERADIVHHNMTAGVAAKLRIAYDDCIAVNPDVVYCNTWAYGLEGPLAHFGGLDPLFQAATGIEYDAGPVQEGNPPLYLRFGMTDTANAMLSVVGCLAALYHRRKTGEGQELWTSLLDGAAVLEADAMLVDGVPVERPHLDKGQYGIDACYRMYRTSDGGFIQIAAVKPEHWGALCATLAVPELAGDERFATAGARREHRAELEALFEAVFVGRTGVTWSRRLDDAGVPNQVSTDTHDGELALFDADNERLGLVVEYQHPLMGMMRQFGNLIDFSETPGHIAGPPPMVGQHTREILGGLGYSDAEVDALRADRIVSWPDDDYPWSV